MSLKDLGGAGNAGEKFEGMSLEKFKAKILEKFYEVYGHYENASGSMYIDIYHDGSADNTSSGSVIWKKGLTGKPELEEDLVLSREDAVFKYTDALSKGYSRVFEAITESDIAKGLEQMRYKQTTARRDGWLGTYRKGGQFFRLNEFTEGEFYIEIGSSNIVTETMTEDAVGAKFELDRRLASGYVKDGTKPPEPEPRGNPWAAFGIEPPKEFLIQPEPEPEPEESPIDILKRLYDKD